MYLINVIYKMYFYIYIFYIIFKYSFLILTFKDIQSGSSILWIWCNFIILYFILIELYVLKTLS